jgi:hypothetical protein
MPQKSKAAYVLFSMGRFESSRAHHPTFNPTEVSLRLATFGESAGFVLYPELCPPSRDIAVSTTAISNKKAIMKYTYCMQRIQGRLFSNALAPMLTVDVASVKCFGKRSRNPPRWLVLENYHNRSRKLAEVASHGQPHPEHLQEGQWSKEPKEWLRFSK